MFTQVFLEELRKFTLEFIGLDTLSEQKIRIKTMVESLCCKRSRLSVQTICCLAGKLVVAHVAQGEFTALAGVCTHEAYDISRYEIATKPFLCPCHAAYFNIEGTPVWGPAHRPLTKYETRLENNLLKIKL